MCASCQSGHEIKTPITIIDADAEVLSLEIGENEWLQDIRRQTQRLSTLTKDLIYLSKMEETQNIGQMIDFPLSDIVADTAQHFESLAKMQGKSVLSDIAPMISFCGDEKAIRQLISILLDNVLKYSSNNSAITLALKRQARAVVIAVSNISDTISEGDLPHLFDRFYRADKSRNSESGGYGIGLSIAQAIVNSHKGKITASYSNRVVTISATLQS